MVARLLWLSSAAGLPSAHAQSAPAAQSTVAACAQSYSAGQEERLRGNRLEAIEHFELCSASSCPDVVVRDCSRWLREVRAELASVRFVIRDPAGHRLDSAEVTMNDEALTLRSDGSALVPPGEHRFRFEAPGHHPTTIEHKLGVGERGVEMNVVLMPLRQRRQSPEPAQRERAPARAATEDGGSAGGVPVASIVAGSVGAIALGVGIGFGVSARSNYYKLERECAPNCSPAAAENVSRKAMIADVALATGVIAVGAAFWIYFAHDDSGDTAVGIGPGPDGSQARLRATF